jgi:DNA-directed RNA polymerase specialized sigma24 family protein
MSSTVRDVHNRQSALSRYRAERLLRKGFEQLRAKVLAVVRSKLRARGVSLDRSDLEACYSQAWHGLYSAVLGGEAVESPEGWLVLATFRRAIEEARSASRAQPGVEQDVAAGEDAPVGAGDPDIADAIDDHARLRALFEGLRSRLSPRECEAASLCYLQGLSRADAAVRMGIAERRLQKLMEGPGGGVPGVAGKVGELLASIQAGGWCEQQSSLMRAYAFGILDPDGERHALAVAHTRRCPACRAHVAALRGLASVLPPLPLLLPLPGGGNTRPATSATRRDEARRVVARVTRRLVPGRLPSPAKLAVTGVALLGTGSGYLLTRPSPPPARAQPAQAATASSASQAKGASRGPRGRIAGSHAPARARRRSIAPGRSALPSARSANARVIRAAPASPSEFSPERVRGEALPSGATRTASTGHSASATPSPAPGAESEFGVE